MEKNEEIKYHFVQKKNLFTPSLESISKFLQEKFKNQFESYEISTCICPDLTKYHLASSGICGKTKLVDVGGIPNIMNKKGRKTTFNLNNIAKICDNKSASIIGAGAGALCVLNKNTEYVPNCFLEKNINNSYCSGIDKESNQAFCQKYESEYFGGIGNFFVSEGKNDNIIKIVAEKKIMNKVFKYNILLLKNFVQIIQEILQEFPEVGNEKQIGVGGLIYLEKGKIKAHIMPDFPEDDLNEADVNNWLKFFEMGPDLVLLTTFITNDPTGGFLNLRNNHTHFYSMDGSQAGHFHFSTTPDEVKYVAFLNIAEELIRIDDAYLKVYL